MHHDMQRHFSLTGEMTVQETLQAFFLQGSAGCLPAVGFCLGRARAIRCLRSLARWRNVVSAAITEAPARRSRSSPTLPSLSGEIARRQLSSLSAPL